MRNSFRRNLRRVNKLRVKEVRVLLIWILRKFINSMRNLLAGINYWGKMRRKGLKRVKLNSNRVVVY
jgi:hypothetical protein